MPVGPQYNVEWLKEAINSVRQQTVDVDELFIVGDGVFIKVKELFPDQMCSEYYTRVQEFGKKYYPTYGGHLYGISFWQSPAKIGFASIFNIGVALSKNDLVIYLASDDKLMPRAVETALNTYKAHAGLDAWYAFSYVDSEGTEGVIPINAAMITKKLWYHVGGYPPAAFVGPDAAVLSCLMKHAPERIIQIDKGNPLYWIRNHDQQETKTHTWRFVDEMNSIRNKLTEDFTWKD